MMQHLTNDPSFWVAFWALMGMLVTAAATLLGLLIAWAKARTAEYEARSAKGTADSAIAGQGLQQATLVQHGEAIAALQATNPGVSAQAQPMPPAPVLTVPPAPTQPTLESAPRIFNSTLEGTPPAPPIP